MQMIIVFGEWVVKYDSIQFVTLTNGDTIKCTTFSGHVEVADREKFEPSKNIRFIIVNKFKWGSKLMAETS